MMSAIALRAMEHALAAPEQRLRTATTMFVSTVRPGPLEIRVERLRAGRTGSQLQATVRPAGATEGGLVQLADPWRGQKTGAFLDQRANRLLAAQLTRPGGTALDCFTYHGSFALHLATVSARVVALDASADALARGRANAALNGLTNVDWLEGDAFDELRRLERERRQFDTIVVDPPAFAKSKGALPRALRGYKEVNLRAMRLLAPGGVLLTASCSHHVSRAAFLDLLADAAADSGRRLMLSRLLGQDVDHPEILTIPETGYLKGAVLTRVG
jgi:23S rRNA (cytosine1962-C5)-methyltransferase